MIDEVSFRESEHGFQSEKSSLLLGGRVLERCTLFGRAELDILSATRGRLGTRVLAGFQPSIEPVTKISGGLRRKKGPSNAHRTTQNDADRSPTVTVKCRKEDASSANGCASTTHTENVHSENVPKGPHTNESLKYGSRGL